MRVAQAGPVSKRRPAAHRAYSRSAPPGRTVRPRLH